MSEVKGSGLECQAAIAQEQRRGATLCPRSGAAAERSYPTSGLVVAGRTYRASEIRGGGREEAPHV